MRPGFVQSFVLTLLSAGFALGGTAAVAAQACSDEWYRSVESRLGTGDAQGHSPDVGSDEWKSVVEFRLGVRGRAEVPPRDDERWCAYVEERLRTAELQARNRLVKEIGPVRYVCDDAAGTQIMVSFFDSEPGTLIARRGDEEVLMYAALSASGVRYGWRRVVLGASR